MTNLTYVPEGGFPTGKDDDHWGRTTLAELIASHYVMNTSEET